MSCGLQFSKYFRMTMSFWEECQTLTFGRLLGGVSCMSDSDCYVGVCSRTNFTCSYTKDQGERGFVQVRGPTVTAEETLTFPQCLLDKMSLYPFLYGLQEKLALPATPTPDEVLPHYRTRKGCWKNYEVQFPADKREHVYVLSGTIISIIGKTCGMASVTIPIAQNHSAGTLCGPRS